MSPIEDSIEGIVHALREDSLTTFRASPIAGAVGTAADESSCAPHCCAIEREPG